MTVRRLFTPASGSRARNIARAVLPALVLCRVPWIADLSATQLSAIYIAIEGVFSGGAEIFRRV